MVRERSFYKSVSFVLHTAQKALFTMQIAKERRGWGTSSNKKYPLSKDT